MRPTSSHLLVFVCLLLAGSWVLPVHAQVRLAAQSIALPGATLRSVEVQITDSAAAGVHVRLRAGQADVPAMGWRRVGVVLDGNLQRDERLRWVLDGTLRLSGASVGTLRNAHVNVVLNESANSLLIDLVQGKGHANIALPLDQPTHAQIRLENMPVDWLAGLLGTVWSGRPTQGRLDAQLALDLRDNGLQSSGRFTINDLAFDTPAGSVAGQGLSASGGYRLDSTGDAVAMDLNSRWRGGELLLGPLYANLPDHPVQVDLHASARHGAVALTRLEVNDADALQLAGALSFDAKGDLKTLQIERLHASFPAAYRRYAQAWLGTLGLRDMQMTGELNAQLDLRGDGLHGFAFRTDGLDLAAGDGRFAFDDLRGGIDWSLTGTQPATKLGWDGLKVYRISAGAAQAQWQSQAGVLSLQEPLSVPLLGGQLRVGALHWRPAADEGERLALSLALTGVDMSAFSQAMGWPSFPGTLAGAIPSLHWVDDRIVLEGGLSASLFGGFVDMTHLSLQHPFGEAPILSGDISIRQLDLAAITSVFDFGSITGRLDGSIDDLRLVNWTPVAFDASLLADSGGRISQRAVNNLTSVGGGGIAAGLQGAVLKLFDTFGYKQIGLNCTLKGSVCTMSGIEPTEHGYTIVEGRGLPHLHVIGHQTRVDWPTLVKRLQAAIHGTAPEVH